MNKDSTEERAQTTTGLERRCQGPGTRGRSKDGMPVKSERWLSGRKGGVSSLMLSSIDTVEMSKTRGSRMGKAGEKQNELPDLHTATL